MIYQNDNQYKDNLCNHLMKSYTNIINTHTRWMTIKEYKKHSKQTIEPIDFNNKKYTIVTRTHIYFV